MKKNKYIISLLWSSFLLLLCGAFTMPDNSGSYHVTGKTGFDGTDTLFLWNGRGLDDLDFVWAKSAANPSGRYKISGGTISFSARAKGYFRSKRVLRNFKLHAEWSWPDPEEHGNSGVLLFIQKPDSVWPQCIQVQLKADHAGDLIAMDGAEFSELPQVNGSVAKFAKSNEKAPGGWNSCDVICQGDSMRVYINGTLQNHATKIHPEPGYVGFQMEGKPIRFRNIYLVKE